MTRLHPLLGRPSAALRQAAEERVLTGLSTPVTTCSRLRQTCVAAVGALLAACTTAPVDPPDAGDEVLAYEPRSGAWVEVLAAEVPDGAELLHEGQLFEQTATGPEWLGAPDPESLHLADAAFSEVDCHPEPLPEDWVLVLDPPRHAPLSEVEEGETVAFAGRLFEVQGGDVVPTGDAIGRVVGPMSRTAPTVIEARIQGPKGEDVLYATPEHPFWVPIRQDFRSLGSIPVGTTLHVQGGGEAILVGKTWRYGDVEVFNTEVEGLHSYYVHGQGGGDGIWVHNSCLRISELMKALARLGSKATDAAGETASAGGTLFRSGGSNPGNFGMRPGEEGVSFRDSLSNPVAEGGGPHSGRPVFQAGDAYVEVDPAKLPAGSVVRDGVPAGHVTVTATADEIKAAVINKGRLPEE